VWLNRSRDSRLSRRYADRDRGADRAKKEGPL
jgi:hypothetical protein